MEARRAGRRGQVGCGVGPELDDFHVLPKDRVPPHLRVPGNAEQHWVADTTRIRVELGYRERVTVADALKRTIEWERSHPPGDVDPGQFDYAAEDAVLAEIG